MSVCVIFLRPLLLMELFMNYIFFQGPQGDHNVERCLQTVEDFVMKPQREGGGMLTTAKHAYHVHLDLFDHAVTISLS